MKIEETVELLDRVRCYGVTINSLRNELKKSDDMSEVVLDDIDNQTELVMNIRTLINSIKNYNVRNVMRMRYINNYSFVEISKQLDMSYQWVNKLHKRGLVEMSKLIEVEIK